MLRFLVDANLPYYFLLWRSNEFVHVFDLNDRWTDNAKELNLTDCHAELVSASYYHFCIDAEMNSA